GPHGAAGSRAHWQRAGWSWHGRSWRRNDDDGRWRARKRFRFWRSKVRGCAQNNRDAAGQAHANTGAERANFAAQGPRKRDDGGYSGRRSCICARGRAEQCIRAKDTDGHRTRAMETHAGNGHDAGRGQAAGRCQAQSSATLDCKRGVFELRLIWRAIFVFSLAEILRSEEHTSELQSHLNLVCRLLLEKKKKA